MCLCFVGFFCVYVIIYGTWCLCYCFYVLGLNSYVSHKQVHGIVEGKNDQDHHAKLVDY